MYLGIDVGGTKTLIARFTENGVQEASLRFPTPPDYRDFIRELAKNVVEISTNKIVAAGIAIPGKVDRSKGVGVAFGNLAWKNVPIKDDLEKFLHFPVAVENDANLGGLSESMLLPQYSRVLYVTISTGIGTGFVVDRKIEPGFADTEGGHMILEHNGELVSWESFASGKAIVKKFGKRAEDIHDAKTWKIIAHNIALGLIDLIAVIQPEVIVFGGGVDIFFERFQPYLEAELKKFDTPLTPIPALMKAQRPDEAVIFGCYDYVKSIYGKTS